MFTSKIGSSQSRPMQCYRDPTQFHERSLQYLSLYIHQFLTKSTSKVPFQIRIVILYNNFYNWAARCFWRIFHNTETEDWADVVGSFAENSFINGSDVDILCCKGIVLDNEDDIPPENLFGLVVVTDDVGIPPGCCWLRRFSNKCEENVSEDRYFECEATGEVDGHTHYPHSNNMDKIVCYRAAVLKGPDNNDYFSSKIFSDYHGKKGLTEYRRINKCLPKWNHHGPAFTQTYFGFISVDVAHCFSCLKGWPDSARDWATRPREYKWPSETMIEDILQSGFDVVAIPSKITQTETSDIEWRISFRKAETKLIKSFNDVQRSCFLILKILVKQFIIPMFPDRDLISTYTVKTLMFWTIEVTEPSFWYEENLLKCLQLCLDKLCQWARDKYCPSYFIPSYNLFRTKLSDMNEVGFLENLQDELERGWMIMLECKYFIDLRKKWKKKNYNERDFINSIKKNL